MLLLLRFFGSGIKTSALNISMILLLKIVKVIIPNNVVTVGESAFAGSGLKSVTSFNSVQVSDTVFFDCYNLKHIYLTEKTKKQEIIFFLIKPIKKLAYFMGSV